MVGEIVGGATAAVTLAAAWYDLRKRTNGQGPIGQEQKKQGEKLDKIAEEQDRQSLILRDLIRWQVDHLLDHGEQNKA